MHINGTVCLGQDTLTGERYLYVGPRVGRSTLAQKFCDPVNTKMSGVQSLGMYSPDPVNSSLMGRCVSEWDALKYTPGEEQGLPWSKIS